MKLLGYLGKNFLSTLAGVYLLLQLAVRVKQHPATLFEQSTLDTAAGAVVLIAAQDPAKLRALVARVTTPTSGTDGHSADHD